MASLHIAGRCTVSVRWNTLGMCCVGRLHHTICGHCTASLYIMSSSYLHSSHHTCVYCNRRRSVVMALRVVPLWSPPYEYGIIPNRDRTSLLFLHENAGLAIVVTAGAATPRRCWPLVSYGPCLWYNCKYGPCPRWSHGPRASPLFSLPPFIIVVKRYSLAIPHSLSLLIFIVIVICRAPNSTQHSPRPAQHNPELFVVQAIFDDFSYSNK